MATKSKPSQKKLVYRGYFFSNFYLSSLQHGLQTAHVVARMFWLFNKQAREKNILLQWANTDQTIIILNGGNQSSLKSLHLDIMTLSKELRLPYAAFYEDLASLNEALTCVGVIVPDTVYDLDLLTADDGDYPERELKELLSKYKLAH